jgi:hypothetical protein
VGAVTVLVARFVAPEPSGREEKRPVWQQVVGVMCGFVFGLAVGIPAEFAFASSRGIGLSPSELLQRYLIGGLIMGLGIAIGLVLGARRNHRVALIIAVGSAAIAGLAIGALTWIWPDVGLPNFVPVGDNWWTALQYTLVGALLGAGLAGGWLQARRVWQRWQTGQTDAFFR